MADKVITYEDLTRMAEERGVSGNPLFVSAAGQYLKQRETIGLMYAAMEDEGIMVGAAGKLYPNPVLKELPKHTDAANRTLSTMLEIILKVGHEPEKAGRLAEILDE